MSLGREIMDVWSISCVKNYMKKNNLRTILSYTFDKYTFKKIYL
jgi:hypothetical protein